MRRCRESLPRCAVIGVVLLCISACSERNVSVTSAFGDRNPASTQSGIFKAGNVDGLSYVSGSQSGVTGAGGAFTCTTGQTVAFSLGNVDLGDAACTTMVHPAALTASGSLMDASAVNMTRFLLLLDGDQLPDNGIVIPESLRSLASSWPAIDFAAADFEAELVRVISDIGSSGRANITMPSSAEAFAYLDASLSCAYSGVFVNSFPAGPFSAPTDVAVIVYRDAGSPTDLFNARIRRAHPQSHMFLEAHGTVELKTLPTFNSDVSSATGTIAADYQTPDVVNGSWANAVAQQPIDRTGFFSAYRIGRVLGEHRFMGTVTRLGEGSARVVVAAVTFVLDGDTVTGEMFDFSLGVALRVSGRRLPGTDSLEFNTELVDTTATATLLKDASGELIGVDGDWPGTTASFVNAVGCRMN